MTQAICYINANDSNQFQTIPKQAIRLTLTSGTNKGIILNKATLLSALATACGFPDYCHINWDSAFDCLTDSKVENLILDLRDIDHTYTADFNAFKHMIEDAYADFGKPILWILTTASNA